MHSVQRLVASQAEARCAAKASKMLSRIRSAAPSLAHLSGFRGLAPRALFTDYGIRESSSSTGNSPGNLSFDDHALVYEGWSTEALVTAWLVFKLSANPAFVKNSEALLEQSKKLLGEERTYKMLESSFYKASVWGNAYLAGLSWLTVTRRSVAILRRVSS